MELLIFLLFSVPGEGGGGSRSTKASDPGLEGAITTIFLSSFPPYFFCLNIYFHIGFELSISQLESLEGLAYRHVSPHTFTLSHPTL